ncbi:hypothetical protein LTR91_024636 [Friedmanniomyces endolithicus]|uniref:Xylanolytic transcriptional activator regulatory domain-containing protein n=1 Tax=Friedmanniomyces endolithicus TaxID=329885 RepID=A0AAN6H3Z2_9PEZI|nr:hypothetical protein LTR75_016464 [Friedmanniomyces endolithicus]KAK0843212.1 hypothetical protein LTS02_016194 [Friedmanniomyces endolithicus]KAK0862339.1 hypothetical protein LTR87_016625 [Friedmanniomyces endolithicus]KAK0888456.1 hypothetical protein LTR02_016312 [Friedmanniomyces endolithicus]KAK0900441.1 hypothetical protein LTR57_020592 [Friedmanniomyces endolithicus]
MPKAIELTFVHQYAGDTPKRRRLAKACEACRTRKKRCIHCSDADSDTVTDKRPDGSGHGRTDSAQSTDRPSTATTASNGDTQAGTLTALQQQSPAQPGGGKKFISDLIAASTLLNRAREDERGRLLPNDDIGIWIDKLEYDELIKRRDDAAGGEDRSMHSKATTRQNGTRPADIDHPPRDQRPHSAVLGPLIDVYFTKIHPILPLVDEVEFRAQQAEGEVPEPLVHALCLVAAKDTKAWIHLKIQASPSTLPPREFCSRLHASVTGALRAPCQYDKVTLIRILALASMHSEGPDGAEESSMLLSQAMHHAQTMAIHLGQSNGPSHVNLAMKRLFWSLWVLDRTNSVINGRPVVMSDADIAIEPFAPQESGFPAFEAWLRITELLNKIIAFYRPHYPLDVTGWEDQFLGLEEILDEVHGWDLSPSLHMTIHLYYLTVAVLSHRSRGIKLIPRATNSSIRQRLCASEIIRLMESDHAGCGLHALPFVPYAVSLTLSVAYQHLRQSQFLHQQEDACQEFRKCTRILQSLRRTWSSADTMAALARKVQDEIERASSLASFRVTRAVQRQAGDKAGAKEVDVPCAPALNGERTGLLGAIHTTATDHMHGAVNAGGASGEQQPASVPLDAAEAVEQPAASLGLFDGMDDVFGTYMDPNYPVNLDDLSFLDDLQPFDYPGYDDATNWTGDV